MLKGDALGQDPAALERFKQELKLARRIAHRYIREPTTTVVR
jgi:hypothetical protein